MNGGPTIVVEPSVIVPARVCSRLARPLARLLRDARRNGELVDPGVLEVVEAITILARAHRSHDREDFRPPSVNGTSEVPTEAASLKIVPVMSTTEVAGALGCSSRNVLALAARGTLPGQRVGRTWAFDPESVAALIDQRGAL